MSEKDENLEQSFNDAELQDIMNEIESLEKEFVEEEGTAQTESVEASQVDEDAPAPENESDGDETSAESDESLLQEAESLESEEVQAEAEEVEAEAEEVQAEIEEESSPIAEVEEETNNVVAMPIAQTPTTQPTSNGEGYMQFSGQGEMDMQLNFQLGSETATVNIKDGGLTVTLAGVQLNLSENGCEVNMEGGVKFSVPLTGKQTQEKKAA
jgi:hypothetical protein